MQWTAQRDRLRTILNGSECIRPASVFDPLSARVAEHLGFELGLFAGSTASLTVLGAPDLVLLTASEFAQQAQRVCRATTIPVLVDADHGYGNALNVARTVEELATVGVAAATIEDTILPTPFGAGGKPALISLEEGVGKMRAALAGRPDPAFAVVGRTSAPVDFQPRRHDRAAACLRACGRRRAFHRRPQDRRGACGGRRQNHPAADPRQRLRRNRERRPFRPARADLQSRPLADHGGRARHLRHDESTSWRHPPGRDQECRLRRADENPHARSPIRRGDPRLFDGQIARAGGAGGIRTHRPRLRRGRSRAKCRATRAAARLKSRVRIEQALRLAEPEGFEPSIRLWSV